MGNEAKSGYYFLLRFFDFGKQDKKSATNGTFEKIKEVGNPLFLSHKIDEKNS